MHILPFSMYFFLFFNLFLSLASSAAGVFATFTSPHLSLSGVGLFEMVGRYHSPSLAKLFVRLEYPEELRSPQCTTYPLKQHGRERTTTETVNFDKQSTKIASPYSCEWKRGTKCTKKCCQCWVTASLVLQQ